MEAILIHTGILMVTLTATVIVHPSASMTTVIRIPQGTCIHLLRLRSPQMPIPIHTRRRRRHHPIRIRICHRRLIRTLILSLARKRSTRTRRTHHPRHTHPLMSHLHHHSILMLLNSATPIRTQASRRRTVTHMARVNPPLLSIETPSAILAGHPCMFTPNRQARPCFLLSSILRLPQTTDLELMSTTKPMKSMFQICIILRQHLRTKATVTTCAGSSCT